MTVEQSGESQVRRIWLVVGDKAGDNAQVEIIADALGLPHEVRRVQPLPQWVLGKPRFEASLYHLDLERSDALEPPWPDLIITVGRRPAMAALWVQERSGGHTRIVLLGRPKKWFERFALIIVPSQYRMPDDPRVLSLDLPLMRSNEGAVREAAEAWRDRFAALPRPITAVLVGGQTKPFVFGEAEAQELLAKARIVAGDGFLYITTSRRTPPAVIAALERRLPANAWLHRWRAGDPDNPYLALLGLADRFIVTGDSISMMVEVTRLGKPLAIYELPVRENLLERLQLRLGDWLHDDSGKFRAVLARVLFRLGLVRYSRDITSVHRLLYRRGFAVPLGEQLPTGGAVPADELAPVVARIRSLLQC